MYKAKINRALLAPIGLTANITKLVSEQVRAAQPPAASSSKSGASSIGQQGAWQSAGVSTATSARRGGGATALITAQIKSAVTANITALFPQGTCSVTAQARCR